MEEKMGEKPRPWRRFCARMVDYVLYGAVVGLIFALGDITVSVRDASVISVGLIFLFTFIEAGFLSVFGATPGKALLGLHVATKAGKRLTYSQGLARSLSVWWLGLGAALYIVSFITMIVACTKLSNNGETVWDKQGGYIVHAKPLTVWRVAIVVLIVVALLGASYVGNTG